MIDFVLSAVQGAVDLPWWGYVLVLLGTTHVTIAAVTIFLHRAQAHRALDLHPIVSHFFRMWLWLTTGMVTREWVAIHRKHHAKCETAEDPHSPMVYGHWGVLRFGVDLYRKEAKNAETISRYGYGTPDDWMERNVYGKYTWQGMGVSLIIFFALFGFAGLAMWAIQLAWIPITAAGIINGTGHFWGYRNYSTDDTSTNISPIGIIIGGEELHNNHHAFGASAKFAHRWYEFDIGWIYIRMMSAVGLAHVRKVAPALKIRTTEGEVDETLQAIITHRYRVMQEYARVVKATAKAEFAARKARAGAAAADLPNLRQLLADFRADAATLADAQRARLAAAFAASDALKQLYQKRQELVALWGRSTESKEQLVARWKQWRASAEGSNIAPLQAFSLRLARYA
ncbi:MAG TPA: fatty acid desaturase [Casimicrobium huifangae]|uniref:DesA family fatty acid desaturase n=1 Tax=Casimicrobium huifangae TaxID=2591109 RepID=UPI001EE1D1CA|nr:fatty acid desaturase [Casimicrobium huifangae]HOB00688.1 fatty acid desaturase [Casimicrobium huifangae]HQA34146.1 fatty acid desaturase [Casimicrobium huifangae]